MSRRKGEITSAQIDRDYPFQVALPADSDNPVQSNYDRARMIDDFCRGLSRAPLGHSIMSEDKWWNVYCFADRDHAARFQTQFNGVPFDPKDRGRGSSWSKWNRKS